MTDYEPYARCPWCPVMGHPFALLEHQLMHVVAGYRPVGFHAVLREPEHAGDTGGHDSGPDRVHHDAGAGKPDTAGSPVDG